MSPASGARSRKPDPCVDSRAANTGENQNIHHAPPPGRVNEHLPQTALTAGSRPALMLGQDLLTKGTKMTAQRVQYFTESVIREMTRLASQHGAINLGQGMPDFETPQEIKDAACQAIQDGFNQYAITWGAPGPAPGHRRQGQRVQRHRLRPRHPRHRLLRGHRVHDGHHARPGRPGRRGHHLPALLRELRPRRPALRGEARLGVALRRRTGGFDPDELRRAFSATHARPSSSTRPTTRPATSSPARN